MLLWMNRQASCWANLESNGEASIRKVNSLAQNMAVSIQFLGSQRHITDTDSIDMPITGETKVSDAIEYLRQKYPSIHLDDGMIVAVVNLETASPDRILRDNDIVSFLPVIGGG